MFAPVMRWFLTVDLYTCTYVCIYICESSYVFYVLVYICTGVVIYCTCFCIACGMVEPLLSSNILSNPTIFWGTVSHIEVYANSQPIIPQPLSLTLFQVRWEIGEVSLYCVMWTQSWEDLRWPKTTSHLHMDRRKFFPLFAFIFEVRPHFSTHICYGWKCEWGNWINLV
jgi:hypothetical protein